MVTAMIVAVAVLLAFAGPISDFVHRHPTLQTLVLCFLILIGVMLVAEGIEKHIERGYLYFAMTFSLVVELLNRVCGSKAWPCSGTNPKHRTRMLAQTPARWHP